MLRAIFSVKVTLINSRIKGIPKLNIPIIENIPIIGRIISGHSVLVYISIIIIVPVCYILLYKTPFGLRLRASGQDSKVVDSIGLKSIALSFKAILICGFLSGIGGSFLSLGYMTMFTENMSNGRGWISLASIIVTKGNPVLVLAVSLIFGLMEGLGLVLQKYEFPSQITSMLPYIAVLIVLYANSKTKKVKESINEV
jgi:simple sugar transport system permease protein